MNSDKSRSEAEQSAGHDYTLVDGLELQVIGILAILIATPIALGMAQVVDPAFVYGGDLCSDRPDMVVTCGTAPVGLPVALLVGFALAIPINERVKNAIR